MGLLGLGLKLKNTLKAKKVSETITSVKGKYNIKKKKKKSWKDYVDTSHPSYKKNWPPGN